MKPSHFTTPRSLDECVFDPRGQAIFTPTPSSVSDKVLYIAFAAIAVALVIILTVF